MKNKKRYIILPLMMIVLFLVGCGKKEEEVTPTTIFERVGTAMAEYTSAEIDVDYNYVLATDQKSDNDSDTDLVVSGNHKITQTVEATKTEGYLNLDLFGAKKKIEVSNFNDNVNGVIYNYEKSDRSWFKEPNSAILNLKDFASFMRYPDKFTLSKEVEKINGVKCYKLSGVLTEEDINSEIGNFFAATGKYTKLVSEINSFKSFTAKIIVYIDSEYYEPVSIAMDLSDSELSPFSDEDAFKGKFNNYPNPRFSEAMIFINISGINQEIEVTILEDALAAKEEGAITISDMAPETKEPESTESDVAEPTEANDKTKGLEDEVAVEEDQVEVTEATKQKK